jgi:hypothetical protein
MMMMIFVCVFVCEYEAYLMPYLYVKKNIWNVFNVLFERQEEYTKWI